jgi:CubicO group peptidase (beta-lactamase class C family)
MRRQTFVVLLFCFSVFHSIFGQQSFRSWSYREALADLVLLRNEGQLLPLQRLDTLRIAYLNAGTGDLSVFSDYLGRYSAVATLKMPIDATTLQADEWVAKMRQQFNLMVVGISEDSTMALPQQQQLFFQALIAKIPTITVIFNAKKQLQALPILEKSTGLIVEIGTPEGQSLAAQLIFGGTTTNSKLTLNLSSNYLAGAGLEANASGRLGYAPAEWVGMNNRMIQDSIAAIVREGIKDRAYPGAQVLVAKDGKVIYQQAFGYHTFEPQQPVLLSDIYDFASVTKISTGLPVLMKWYGEGKFDIDAPLEKYLPETKGSNKADLKMRNILTHTARLMAWIPFWRGTLKGNSRYPWQRHWDNNRINDFKFKPRSFREDSSRAYNVFVTDRLWLHRNYYNKLYQSIYKSPLNAKPGYVYSDFFFYTMPRIVQQQTGIAFEDYIKSTFYRRLGAYSLTFNPLRFFPKDRIIPTERDTFYRMAQLLGTVHDEGASMLGGVSGHAGLFGTAGDLAKLMQMYLNFGSYGGEKFIEEKALREFTRCQYCDQGIHRGLGFDKPLIEWSKANSSYAKDASAESFGHSGYTGTFTWADPKNDLLFIFFCNRVYPTRLNRKLYDKNIRPRIHDVLYKAMQ